MIATHSIKEISFRDNIMTLLIDDKEVNILLDKVSRKLLNANSMQRDFYTISPSGYGIHWPLIDEDLSVESLLKFSELN
ncbi:MAG: DUF2442 domain-containing protein [Bacteroidetes bacterium]|jgi:hypothetical protein|nr:DUF2442 domain-containing protein [Bacteroidota bacterium]